MIASRIGETAMSAYHWSKYAAPRHGSTAASSGDMPTVSYAKTPMSFVVLAERRRGRAGRAR